MDPESGPEQRTREPRRDSLRRHGRRTWLYTWASALVALLVILIALVVANTGRVKVSWVLGSTRQSLGWIILVTAILGWLLGIVTSRRSWDKVTGGRIDLRNRGSHHAAGVEELHSRPDRDVRESAPVDLGAARCAWARRGRRRENAKTGVDEVPPLLARLRNRPDWATHLLRTTRSKAGPGRVPTD